MGLIVHLTDLHLGAGGTAKPADDRKVNVISDHERTSIRDLAEEQLQKLSRAIKERGQVISALVLSGDITVQGAPDGYEELTQFLKRSFAELLPEPGRIVATPGNHDVVWYEVDAAKRYEQFIAHCVGNEFVTPPLDGVDLVGGKGWTASDRHVLIDADEGWFIVPLNSSNWSGTKAGLFDLEKNPLDELKIESLRKLVEGDKLNQAILEQLLKFRQYDMPRVSKAQIAAFRQAVSYGRGKLAPNGQALALAVMHHQLSPVSEREELKPFESLSNLGRVRAVLEESAVAITLHGHKHDQLAMWNTTERGSQDGRARHKHEMLVVSGGTIGGSPVPDPSRFATVIEIKPTIKGHEVRIQSAGEYLVGDGSGTRAYFHSGKRFEPVGRRGGHIEASSFSECYARLLNEGEIAAAHPVNNLSVTLMNLSGVEAPPEGYPPDAAGEGGALPLNQWFNVVADWWQSELIEAPRGLFTHGRRLRLHNGKPNSDQILAMRKILKDRRATNGRAIATLIDAGTDILGENGAAPATFPAFCLVQLHLESGGPGMLLNATAYFRKQEMRYWWPVNIAEIKRVMETALKGMKDTALGSVTTVAAVAVWQTSRSRVSIPAVDRLYLQDEKGRGELMRMAAVLAQPPKATGDDPERQRLRRLWAIVLEDIVPPAESVRDSIPVAVEGVRFLKDAVNAHVAIASDTGTGVRLKDISTQLNTLEQRGTSLWELGRKADSIDFESKLALDVEAMQGAREKLREALDLIFQPQSVPLAQTE